MLLVHPVHEVLRQLPLLVGAIVLGSATGNPMWAVAALAVTVGLGLARWFTTTYRIEPDEVQLRTGVLQRKMLSVPRNRIRSVQTDARLLHRLLGLTVLRVSTGQEAKGDGAFELDAVDVGEVPRLRALLLARSPAPAGVAAPAPGTLLARWQPSWLRYSPLSLSGLLMILAAIGVASQAGAGEALQRSNVGQAGLEAAERFGAAATVTVVAVAVLVASVLLAVLRSLVTYGNLVLKREPGTAGADGAEAGVLYLQRGLLRVREYTYDMRRLRGGTLRQPLLVRAFGGARLDAVMTGVNGAGESSLLLPSCPAATAEAVLAGLVDDPEVVSGPVIAHGSAAARRRWTRALVLPVLAGVVLAVVASTVGTPLGLWLLWAVVTAAAAALAADRVGSLGHRVSTGWLVTRSGSLERRRDCIATAGIIGWTVRQTLMQRRAGVATLVAATAAGTKRYEVIDVPAGQAWVIAAQASSWVADSIWAVR